MSTADLLAGVLVGWVSSMVEHNNPGLAFWHFAPVSIE